MSKPNRAFANLPKRPFDPVRSFREPVDADNLAEELKAQGFDVKVTRLKVGPRKSPWFTYNVWKRERE